jgi:hypothetical protein
MVCLGIVFVANFLATYYLGGIIGAKEYYPNATICSKCLDWPLLLAVIIQSLLKKWSISPAHGNRRNWKSRYGVVVKLY